MKYTFLYLIAMSLLLSCSHQHGSEANEHAAREGHTGLALNGQEPWQADQATNENIQQLQQLMQDHLRQPNADGPGAIHTLGKIMQQGFEEVFKECRMKGPEHDMLHVYLMPMLEDVKTLESDSPDEALAARNRLAERLSLYQTYFK